jgi:hypothetical protein
MGLHTRSLLLSLLGTFAVAVVSAAVQVIPDFLSHADVERYRQQAGRNRRPTATTGAAHSRGGATRRLHAPVSLEDDLHAKIRRALGEHASVAPLLGNNLNIVDVSTLTGTSNNHIEYYQVGIRFTTQCWYGCAFS